MKAAASIRVEGLRELQQALRNLDGQTQKQIRVALNKAAEIVAAEARRRAPARSGDLRRSVRVSSDQRSAGISMGSASVPYAGFIDYGNKVGSGHGVGRKDSQDRPFIPTGRVMYPAFLAERDAVQEALEQALVDLVKQSGLSLGND